MIGSQSRDIIQCTTCLWGLTTLECTSHFWRTIGMIYCNDLVQIEGASFKVQHVYEVLIKIYVEVFYSGVSKGRLDLLTVMVYSKLRGIIQCTICLWGLSKSTLKSEELLGWLCSNESRILIEDACHQINAKKLMTKIHTPASTKNHWTQILPTTPWMTVFQWEQNSKLFLKTFDSRNPKKSFVKSLSEKKRSPKKVNFLRFTEMLKFYFEKFLREKIMMENGT